ncbi:MAG: TRAP transporter small permease [Bacillota bacterium]
MYYLKKLFDNLEEYILIALFPMMVIVVFVATVARYLQLFSIPWSEELARYIMVWLAYIGASLGMKRGAHLGIDALVSIFPGKLRAFFCILRTVIIVFFCALVVYFSYKIIQHQINIKQTSPALFVPIWWAYLAVPVGCFLMSIRAVQALLFTNGYKVKADKEESV